jgi:hypothetical protein
MTKVIINAVFDNQSTTPPINNIITSVVSGMLQNISNNGGLEGVDLSKAAETYKRVYSGIESQMNRRLSNDEKISLRPQIADVIKQIQNS